MSESAFLVALAILPKISACISIVASALILRRIAKKRRTENETLSMVSLIMINLSIGDIGSSFFTYFLSTWMVPSDTPSDYAAFAIGNSATCTAQGFLHVTFFSVSMWSNGFLAMAYWLTVCRQWSEARIKKPQWKLLFLGFPWTNGIIVAIVLEISSGYGFSLLWACTPEHSVPHYIIIAATFVLVLVTILFSLGALINFVYQMEHKMDNYTNNGQPNNRENTIKVTYQGIWYSNAFLVIAILGLVGTFLPVTPNVYWFWILNAIILPLQGLFNALVYFRPRYVADREECCRATFNGNASILSSVCRVLDICMTPASFCRDSRTSSVRRDSSILCVCRVVDIPVTPASDEQNVSPQNPEQPQIPPKQLVQPRTTVQPPRFSDFENPIIEV